MHALQGHGRESDPGLYTGHTSPRAPPECRAMLKRDVVEKKVCARVNDE